MVWELLTAEAISELAFSTAIAKSAEIVIECAIAKGKELQGAIKNKLQGQETLKTALVEVEENQSQETLKQIIILFLQVEMLKDKQFDAQLQNLAQQIHQEFDQSQNQTNISIDAKAYDQSKQNVFGEIENKGEMNFI